MKTNKLFISLLCASVAAIFMAGCTKTNTEKGPDERDTITIRDTTTMLIPEFGIKSADVCNSVGEYSIYFKPGADWTFTSQTDWLKIVTASGSKGDTVLTVKVTQANETKESRPATTTITVGGVTKTLTITQMGIMPTIKVFSKTVEFSSRVDTGWIYNVFTNCEIEVLSTPEWVNKPEIVVVQPGYEYKVRFEFTPNNFDSDEREGFIVLKDKASDLSTEVRVICSNFSNDFIVNQESIDALTDYIVPGGGTDQERSVRVKINESPDVVEGDVELEFAFFMYQGSVSDTIACDIVRVPGSKSPFGDATYEITVPKYTYEGNFGSPRPVGCFVMAKGDKFDKTTAKPFLILKQQLYLEARALTTEINPVYAPLGSANVSDIISFKVRTGLDLKFKITDYWTQGLIAPTNGVFPGSAELIDRGPSNEEGWDLCKFKINVSDDAKTLDFGTKQPLDNVYPCEYWEHRLCVYSDEYNPKEPVGTEFRINKDMPSADLTGLSNASIGSKTQTVTTFTVTTVATETVPTVNLTIAEKYGEQDFPGQISSEAPTVVVDKFKRIYTFKIEFNPTDDYKPATPWGNDYVITAKCEGFELESLLTVKY